MHVLIVDIAVKPDCIEEFKTAMLDNATNSVLEPGIVRFDVFQQKDDPARFMLVEVYRDEAAHASHRETAHYQRWRDTVEDMMAEPRSARKLVNVHPGDDGWD